jgi:hypothetical protein
MDIKFIITQVVNAVIIIITTIIVTRLSMKGSLSIKPSTKVKLKRIAKIYGLLLFMVAHFSYTVWRLYVAMTATGPVSRRDVMNIASHISIINFYVIFGACALGFIGGVRHWRRYKAKQSSSDT